MARTKRKSQEADKMLLPRDLIDPWAPQAQPQQAAQPPAGQSNPLYEDTPTFRQVADDVRNQVMPTAEAVADVAHDTRYQNDEEREALVDEAATSGNDEAFAELARRAAGYQQQEPTEDGPDWNAELARAQEENKAHDRYTAWSASRAAKGGRLLSADYIHRTDPEEALARRMRVYEAVRAGRGEQQSQRQTAMSQQRLNDPNSPDSMFARRSLRSMASSVGAMNGGQYASMAADMKAMSEDPSFTAERYKYLVDNNLLPIQTILRSSTTANGQVLNLMGRREGQDESAGEAALASATSLNNNLRTTQSADRRAAMDASTPRTGGGGGGTGRNEDLANRLATQDIAQLNLLPEDARNARLQAAGVSTVDEYKAAKVADYLAMRGGLPDYYGRTMLTDRNAVNGAITRGTAGNEARVGSNLRMWSIDDYQPVSGVATANAGKVSKAVADRNAAVAILQQIRSRLGNVDAMGRAVPILDGSTEARQLRQDIMEGQNRLAAMGPYGALQKAEMDRLQNVLPQLGTVDGVMQTQSMIDNLIGNANLMAEQMINGYQYQRGGQNAGAVNPQQPSTARSPGTPRGTQAAPAQRQRGVEIRSDEVRAALEAGATVRGPDSNGKYWKVVQ